MKINDYEAAQRALVEMRARYSEINTCVLGPLLWNLMRQL